MITDNKTGRGLAFEEAREEHLGQLREIYNFYIRTTTHTFNVEELTFDEMRALVFFDHPRWHTFVILDGAAVAGYTILSPFKKREAYDISGEITIYLAPGYTRRGIGPAAIELTERYAVANGYHSLVAIICAENVPSCRLFEKCGYEKCAHFREIGSKFGRMLDVVDYQKIFSTDTEHK